MNNTIQINQLLMEREDRLVELFDLERQIHSALGEPYPLAPPDGLPSRQKRKKPRRKATAKTAPLRLRKLNPEKEAAYRITYLENGTEKTELHTDPKPLALLANTALPDLVIQRIETVQLTESGIWETVETLQHSISQHLFA